MQLQDTPKISAAMKKRLGTALLSTNRMNGPTTLIINPANCPTNCSPRR